MSLFNNTDILRVALKRRITLLSIILLACAGGYFFSGELFIKPKYKSTAVIYPVNIIPYSMETPTEQLLQLVNSADVRTMMIRKYDLADHYHIDTNRTAGKTKLFARYDENISIRQTEYESIRIDIFDSNPDTACTMVNGLIDMVNLKARELQREKTAEVVVIYKRRMDDKQHQIDSLQHLMNELRVRYGLLDYGTQSKEATKAYLKMLSSGSSKGSMRDIDSLMNNLEEKGGQQISLNSQIGSAQDAYNAIKNDYDKAVSDLTKELTYSNIVAKPLASDSKAYPSRYLIVFVCGLSALMFTLILFVILERMKPAGDGRTGS